MKTKAAGIQLTDVTDQDPDGLWDLKIEPVRKDGKIISGLCIGHTLFQNEATLLAMHPGELKSEPTLGVGLRSELLNENLLEARHNIRKVFAKDGMTITKLDLYEIDNIQIDARYDE
ncbi:MAG: hypothetical protein WCY77_10300 [Weeksellaceae bacterium]